MSYKTATFAIALATACVLVVLGRVPPWVLIAVLVFAALVCTGTALRREQIKVDRILSEELAPMDDQTGPSVETTKTSRARVSGIGARLIRRVPRPS